MAGFLRHAATKLFARPSNLLQPKDVPPFAVMAARGMATSKLFVGGLSFNTDENTLRNAFADHGEVLEARIIVDRNTGMSRGFAFITFISELEAETALKAMHGKVLNGRILRVDYATNRPRDGMGSGFQQGGPYPGSGRFGQESGSFQADAGRSPSYSGGGRFGQDFGLPQSPSYTGEPASSSSPTYPKSSPAIDSGTFNQDSGSFQGTGYSDEGRSPSYSGGGSFGQGSGPTEGTGYTGVSARSSTPAYTKPSPPVDSGRFGQDSGSFQGSGYSDLGRSPTYPSEGFSKDLGSPQGPSYTGVPASSTPAYTKSGPAVDGGWFGQDSQGSGYSEVDRSSTYPGGGGFGQGSGPSQGSSYPGMSASSSSPAYANSSPAVRPAYPNSSTGVSGGPRPDYSTSIPGISNADGSSYGKSSPGFADNIRPAYPKSTPVIPGDISNAKSSAGLPDDIGPAYPKSSPSVGMGPGYSSGSPDVKVNTGISTDSSTFPRSTSAVPGASAYSNSNSGVSASTSTPAYTKPSPSAGSTYPKGSTGLSSGPFGRKSSADSDDEARPPLPPEDPDFPGAYVDRWSDPKRRALFSDN